MTSMRWMLTSKIHRATVTAANLDYVGSITIDSDLMEAAGLVEWEGVHVLDVTNGNRLETYVIEGEGGSGEICINGAAAHLVNPGDLVIILAYSGIDESLIDQHSPIVVHVDGKNRPIHTL
ncbi:MAG: aspartate 1-decarboxylase [Candidatus Thalassarchaeaceae archaeon]